MVLPPDPSALSGTFDPYNPFDPRVHADPYPAYALLQEKAPIHWSALFNSWMLTRYDDVVEVLRDPRFSSRRVPRLFCDLSPEEAKQVEAMQNTFSQWLLFSDPPTHTRMRALINKAFVPRIIEKMRPSIESITDELLQEAERQGELEIMRDLAFPLPVMVIGDLLGVPRADRGLLKTWSTEIATFFAGAFRPMAIAAKAQGAMSEMKAYFRWVVADRRKNQKDDLIGVLVSAEEEGTVLNDEELLATCVMLLFAGHETTTNLLGNGMFSLAKHPGEWERLRENRSLVPMAVEEFLRFDGPVQLTARMPKETIRFGEVEFKPGELVFLMLGAANRDPKQFENPNQLDIGRSPNRHLGFAQGIHFCPGAPLSRLEGQIVFDKLVHRFPRLRAANDEVVYQKNMSLRGIESLKLRWD